MSLEKRKLQLALDLGLPVFPCKQDKTPATKNGFKDATADPEGIRQFDWRNRLIGVPTGTASGTRPLA